MTSPCKRAEQKLFALAVEPYSGSDIEPNLLSATHSRFGPWAAKLRVERDICTQKTGSGLNLRLRPLSFKHTGRFRKIRSRRF
jgi:hypothetical protein